MNLFRAAIQPVNFCTSLIVGGAPISVMAMIFTGLASMPRLLMMNPSNFPKSAQTAKRFLQICNQDVGIPGLDDHIIHIALNIPMQLIREAHLDRALIGCSCILEPEGHGFLGICPYGVMNAVLKWSSSLSAI
jgi:hypothetical protein